MSFLGHLTESTEPPYRNFVTRVGYAYQPYVYKNKEALDGILQEKCLINQSTYKLTDDEVELLACGLNYIPPAPSNRKDEERLHAEAERFTRSIDISLHFDKAALDVNGLPIEPRRQQQPKQQQRGWLASYVPSLWMPPTQSWTSDQQIDFKSIAGRLEDVIKGPVTPPRLLAALHNLESRADLSILKSDKGRNIVVWATADYDREALRQLTDTDCYEELTKKEYEKRLLTVAEQVEWLATRLKNRDHITEGECNAMKAAKPAGSIIYFLPKTHKPMQPVSKTFGGRPIVATFTNVVHLLDKYITELTSVLLLRIPGSLKDTGDLLDKLPKGELPDDAEIVTMDVVGLYPSIPWAEGFDATVAFYEANLPFLEQYSRDKGRRLPPSTSLFRTILEMVLRNSILTFKNQRFFHQKLGTAMGMCISVFFANCYMYSITRNVIDDPPDWLILMLRYIDDIILIVKRFEKALVDGLIGRISNPSIGYETVEPQRDQPFLDLALNINRQTHLIETTPYWKPTASGSYLHPSSNHPAHVLKGIPYSQFLRLRRNSSNTTIYIKAAKRLKNDLLRMGYPKADVKKSFSVVRDMTKEELKTPAKGKSPTGTQDLGKDTYKLILPYNQNTDWRAKQRALTMEYKKIIRHYENLGTPDDAAHAALLKSRSALIVSSNGATIGSHFSKFVKIPKAVRMEDKRMRLQRPQNST